MPPKSRKSRKEKRMFILSSVIFGHSKLTSVVSISLPIRLMSLAFLFHFLTPSHTIYNQIKVTPCNKTYKEVSVLINYFNKYLLVLAILNSPQGKKKKKCRSAPTTLFAVSDAEKTLSEQEQAWSLH